MLLRGLIFEMARRKKEYTPAQQSEIKELWASGEHTFNDIAEKFDTNGADIRYIIAALPDYPELRKKREQNLLNKKAEMGKLWASGNHTFNSIADNFGISHLTVRNGIMSLPNYTELRKEREQNLLSTVNKKTEMGKLWASGNHTFTSIANDFGISRDTAQAYIMSLPNYTELRKEREQNLLSTVNKKTEMGKLWASGNHTFASIATDFGFHRKTVRKYIMSLPNFLELKQQRNKNKQKVVNVRGIELRRNGREWIRKHYRLPADYNFSNFNNRNMKNLFNQVINRHLELDDYSNDEFQDWLKTHFLPILGIFAAQKNRCFLTGKLLDSNYEIEHVYPLSRLRKEGAKIRFSLDNIRLSNSYPNATKGSLTMDQFYRKCQQDLAKQFNEIKIPKLLKTKFTRQNMPQEKHIPIYLQTCQDVVTWFESPEGRAMHAMKFGDVPPEHLPGLD